MPVVLGQVAVRDLALDVDVRRERVGPRPAGDPIVGMIAIDSYHDAFFVSYVPDAVEHVALAQPDAPVGRGGGHRDVPGDRSRGLVVVRLERNRRVERPSRVSVRSVHSPPGCRCPPVPTIAPSSGTVHDAGAPRGRGTRPGR